MMKRLLRLYPRRWRERYGSEMESLLDDLPARPSTIFDLMRGAAREQLSAVSQLIAPRRLAGGPSMPEHPLQRHPRAWALVALALMAPTALVVTASLLTFGVGIPGLAAIVEPAMRALDALPRLLDLFLLGAPALAFLLAAAPLVGISPSRTDGELHVTFRLRARLANLLVMVLALVVGAFLYAHVLAEFILEAP